MADRRGDESPLAPRRTLAGPSAGDEPAAETKRPFSDRVSAAVNAAGNAAKQAASSSAANKPATGPSGGSSAGSSVDQPTQAHPVVSARPQGRGVCGGCACTPAARIAAANNAPSGAFMGRKFSARPRPWTISPS